MTLNSEHNLFIGCYGAENAQSIHAFGFNSDTGELTAKGSFSGIENPSFIFPHPNGRWLFAVSETGEGSHGRQGAVWALEIQAETLVLKPINYQSSKGDWPCHLEIDRTGRWLITTNYGSGNAALYPILDSGALGEMTSLVQHEGSGPNQARQEGPHAHSAIFTPDNKFVIVADLGIDQLVIYAFDSDSGSLTKHGAVHTTPGAGPRHFEFHPNGRILYVANELNSSVTVYAYDAERGAFEAQQTLSTLTEANPENTVADIHISADAKRLYLSNRGDNSIAIFAVDGDGGLTREVIQVYGGDWPRNFALEPSGRFLLVANQYSNDISLLSADSGSTVQGDLANHVDLNAPACIKFL